jgi:hypothetical protein
MHAASLHLALNPGLKKLRCQPPFWPFVGPYVIAGDMAVCPVLLKDSRTRFQRPCGMKIPQLKSLYGLNALMPAIDYTGVLTFIYRPSNNRQKPLSSKSEVTDSASISARAWFSGRFDHQTLRGKRRFAACTS